MFWTGVRVKVFDGDWESERITNLWNSETKISERSTGTFSSNTTGDTECGWGVKLQAGRLLLSLRHWGWIYQEWRDVDITLLWSPSCFKYNFKSKLYL